MFVVMVLFLKFLIFGHFQLLMFVLLRIFLIFIILGPTQSFSVMLNEYTFLVVSFGQVQPNAVYRFWSKSTVTFSHLHSVKLTSLKIISLKRFFCIRPPLGLLPVLGPLERYVTPTLDAALLVSSRAGADLG